MKGYVQVYTGDGKGKTTAALGLAIRAAGADLRVFIGQFVKGVAYCELVALQRFEDRITVRRFGRPSFIHGEPRPEDVAAARDGLARSREVLGSGAYDVVILDEINVAVGLGLLSEEDLLELLELRPPDVELVFTGRGAPPRLIDAADLVTDMVPVKHYYDRGVPARRGIES